MCAVAPNHTALLGDTEKWLSWQIKQAQRDRARGGLDGPLATEALTHLYMCRMLVRAERRRHSVVYSHEVRKAEE